MDTALTHAAQLVRSTARARALARVLASALVAAAGASLGACSRAAAAGGEHTPGGAAMNTPGEDPAQRAAQQRPTSAPPASPPNACRVDADCRLVACQGCSCTAAPNGAPDPCPPARCVAWPCMNHTAACDPASHRCVARTAGAPAPSADAAAAIRANQNLGEGGLCGGVAAARCAPGLVCVYVHGTAGSCRYRGEQCNGARCPADQICCDWASSRCAPPDTMTCTPFHPATGAPPAAH